MNKTRIWVLLIGLMIFSSSCKSDDMEEPPKEEMEMKERMIAGDRIGDWSSVTPLNTYNKIPISAKITATSDPNIFEGEFFFTAAFVSCCGSGVNDGTLTFHIDGNEITEFVYNDILPNCNGTFEGTGTISEKGVISITFEGSDCEGDHTNGIMTFN